MTSINAWTMHTMVGELTVFVHRHPTCWSEYELLTGIDAMKGAYDEECKDPIAQNAYRR